MKKLIIAVVVSLVAFCACDTYDDAPIRNDLKLLEERVTKIEQWCESAKSDLSSMQTLVDAMEGRDYIQSVELILESGYEKGYTITFASGKVIKIWNGEKGADGETPVMGIAKNPSDPTDTNYYWTVTVSDDTEFLKDKDGNLVSVGHTPVITVEVFEGNLCWKIDGEWLLDGAGNKVVAQGSDGTSFFTSVDYTSDPENVKFTLADGSSFSVRRSTVSEAQKITFGQSETGLLNGIYALSSSCDSITISLNVKYEDYSALIVKVYGIDDESVKVVTKRVLAEWPYEITHKPFEAGSNDTNAVIEFSLGSLQDGDMAVVEASLVLVSGETFTSSKIVKFFEQKNAILDGEFTVDTNGKKVKFSRGNLVKVDESYSFTTSQQELGGLFAASEVPSTITVADNAWSVLSSDEWGYLFITHNRIAFTVDGVFGYVLLPDAVKIPDSYDFNSLVALGGVFFPASGYTNPTSSRAAAGETGYYLSSTSGKALTFDATSYNAAYDLVSTTKASVRPVIVIEPEEEEELPE